MARLRPAWSKWIVGSALLFGAGVGYLLTHRHNVRYEFLAGATTLAVRDASVETSSGTIFGTTTYYSFEGDWQQVYRRALEEMPNAITRDGMVDGKPAKVLTIPRVEGGRTRLFFPPEREITILPQRLVLTEGGQIFPYDEPENWASVKVSEYRQPHFLDTAVEWLRDQLHI